MYIVRQNIILHNLNTTHSFALVAFASAELAPSESEFKRLFLGFYTNTWGGVWGEFICDQ